MPSQGFCCLKLALSSVNQVGLKWQKSVSKRDKWFMFSVGLLSRTGWSTGQSGTKADRGTSLGPPIFEYRLKYLYHPFVAALSLAQPSQTSCRIKSKGFLSPFSRLTCYWYVPDTHSLRISTFLREGTCSLIAYIRENHHLAHHIS